MYQIGTVARILAGHDAGGYCVVVGEKDGKILIADGKRRPLEQAKAKNPKHLALTTTYVGEAALSSNKQLRKALHPYQTNANCCEGGTIHG